MTTSRRAFRFYAAQAIRRAAPEVGADALDLVRETFLINSRAIVSSLINDLSDLDEEVSPNRSGAA